MVKTNLNPEVCVETQGFARNANPSYKENKLYGHTGMDLACGFGSRITSPYSGLVYKIINNSQPANDGTGFWGVFIIVDTGIECFEYLVGHCSEIMAKEGDITYVGQSIAKEGNTGKVYSGNEEITVAMKKAGDKRGSHRHIQKRPLKKTRITEDGKAYLSSYQSFPYRDDSGFYYEIIDFDNGYNGCVDPTLPLFSRNLTVNSFGSDVLALQNILVKEGCLDAVPTGFFWWKTLGAVINFQRKNNIFPAFGYIGPKTRTLLNSKYSDQ